MAWEISLFKPLAGPVASLISKLHLVRRARTRIARGGGCFGFVDGKIMIVVPERVRENSTFVEKNDMDAAREIGRMLTNFGFREGKDWDLYYLGPGAALPETVRRQNIISLCGPSANAFIKQIMDEFPELLSSIRHSDADERGTRQFRWQNRNFRTSEVANFAVMGIMPNPYNATRRIVLLFGLEPIGTYGAALLFSSPDYKDVRSAIKLKYGKLNGDLEVLLYVVGSEPSNIAVVRAANLEDGLYDGHRTLSIEKTEDSALLAAPVLSPGELRERLQAIAAAILEYQREIRFTRLVYTFTILEDFSYRGEEVESLSPADQDIVIYHKHYVGTVPCAKIESLQFQAASEGEDHHVIWLPAMNEPLRREFLVFPVQPMKVNEPARTFHFSSVWPGGAEQLKAPHGRDVFEILISPKAAGPVDVVEVFIRFEAPGTYLVKRILETAGNTLEDPRRQEYRVNVPFHEKFTDVPGGTMYSFRIDRIT